MKEIENRVLLKQKPAGYISFKMTGTSTAIDTIVTTGSGWENIPQNNLALAQLVFANRNYIDLSGYTLQDLTTFIQGMDFQHMRDPLQVGPALSAVVWRYDFFTTRRITDDELSQFTDTVPGYLPSSLDLMEMIYGEHKTFAVNSTIPGTFISTDFDTLGSGNASAADRLHWTQVYVLNPAGNAEETGNFQVYPSNLVSQALTGKEKDLVYIERLRRAYTQGR
jgi:hypothetical protein